MDLMRKTLQEVKSGKTIYKPVSDAVDDLRRFQPLANCLHAAQESSLIHSAVFIVSKHRDTPGWFKEVQVSGGLTHKGNSLLSSPPPSALRKWIVDNLTSVVTGVIIVVLGGVILFMWGLT